MMLYLRELNVGKNNNINEKNLMHRKLYKKYKKTKTPVLQHDQIGRC